MGRLVPVLLIALIAVSCGGTSSEQTTESSLTTSTTEQPLPTAGPDPGPFEITSPAYEDGADIPTRFTCDGSDISPPLQISGIPSSAASLALIFDDPDAPTGTWVHWVVYDIDVDGPELAIPEETGPEGTRGINSWNMAGYGGPCPPQGQRHRYIFEVFALDTDLRIPGEVSSAELRTAIEGHVLEQSRLMGYYER